MAADDVLNFSAMQSYLTEIVFELLNGLTNLDSFLSLLIYFNASGLDVFRKFITEAFDLSEGLMYILYLS